ncbi:glucocorticoid receptor-like (DNA-binding domain) [Schizophyllum commune Tattone D]|nr:glucocorticoid receptor-like (DNA-binding domain) [Schizophyllum commune Tattone D]
MSSDVRLSSDMRMTGDPRVPSGDLRMPPDLPLPPDTRISSPRSPNTSRVHSHSPNMPPRYRDANWEQRYMPGVMGDGPSWIDGEGSQSGPLRTSFDTRVIMNTGSRSGMDAGPSRVAEDRTFKRDSPESNGLDLHDASSPTTSERSLPNASQKPQHTEKQCSHCGVKQTPLWRRDPSNFQLLCNACGLFYKQRHMHRPKVLIEADQEDDTGEDDPNAPTCSHCGTHRTSVWRRGKDGTQVCNACGVYSRLRGKERPLALKKNKIRPRTKYPKAHPGNAK